ncbi:hypothetical protein ATN89_17060 [Comamonas thiooxydans]|uniref:hypothetical protein n=1 Tax=Comamonas thiooxydans TaxID=363952 RepID=UPI0007C4586A|nr:hypothetical protein [Comamonas thiooxydans]OAD82928.1 hypothetical protein ATN89_17060 [Comamonas thiooxydans]
MPLTKYKIHTGKPKGGPAVHVTCLTDERIQTVRWWDGKQWWDIGTPRNRATEVPPEKQFKWPAGCGVPKPSWMNESHYKGRIMLRKITHQDRVRWCEPYKHYTPEEVMSWMEETGRIAEDWRERYQTIMRAEGYKSKRAKAK